MIYRIFNHVYLFAPDIILKFLDTVHMAEDSFSVHTTVEQPDPRVRPLTPRSKPCSIGAKP